MRSMSWLGVLLLVGCPQGTQRSTAEHASPSQQSLDAQLEAHVLALATEIGPRHPEGNQDGLERAASYVRTTLESCGLEVKEQAYSLNSGEHVRNLVVDVPGTNPSAPWVLLGAHYDSVATGTPGADDNASGVAVLLELARRLSKDTPSRSIRLVAFTCEEPPYFQTEAMGSLRHARQLEDEGIQIGAMFALDCVGYYSDDEGSQRYLPQTGEHETTRGSFVALVGNEASRELVTRTHTALVGAGELEVQAQVFPDTVHEAGWSDHWSFWQTGVRALVVTDSGPFRNQHYHALSDTPETLDYARMADLTRGLVAVLRAEAAR